MQPQGYVLLVLHAHLPYLRHPEDPDALELHWLYQAITECYLPLLEVLERLEAEGVPFPLTLSLSPTLIAMLADPLLQQRYEEHLERLIALCDREVARTARHGPIHATAQYYQHLLRRRRRQWHRYQGDLLGAWAGLWQRGRIELITTAATHGLLPLLAAEPAAVRAQLRVGLQAFQRAFGHRPPGIWLPECGYYPGLEAELGRLGLRYCFLETHALLAAEPAPPHGVHAPVEVGSGVAAFARDPECSRQVWSSREGYPGDFAYREYYRDVGFDLRPEELKPCLHPEGHRIATGLKYYRITGPTDQKEPYDPAAGLQTADRHAGHFLWCRERQVEYLAPRLGRPPAVLAPFDAELFGHWWFEGPAWLEMLARKAHFDTRIWAFTTPSRYLAQHPPTHGAQPPLSTWGDGGYCDYWCNGENHWVWRHLHRQSARMAALAARYAGAPADSPTGRMLRQAGRELLLAQGSDWPFILRSGTQVEYARRRLLTHLGHFHHLARALEQGEGPPEWLPEAEAAACCFPDLDPAVFA